MLSSVESTAPLAPFESAKDVTWACLMTVVGPTTRLPSRRNDCKRQGMGTAVVNRRRWHCWITNSPGFLAWAMQRL
jgi:hypothetical protein